MKNDHVGKCLVHWSVGSRWFRAVKIGVHTFNKDGHCCELRVSNSSEFQKLTGFQFMSCQPRTTLPSSFQHSEGMVLSHHDSHTLIHP